MRGGDFEQKEEGKDVGQGLYEEQKQKVKVQEEKLESGVVTSSSSSSSLIEHQTPAVARRTLLLYLCRQ